VHINNSDTSSACVLQCEVLQGSVLGPNLFLVYAEDITEVLGRRLLYRMYADDMQGQQHSRPGDHHTVVTALQDTVSDVKEWCSSKRLQLKATKTELLWYGTATNLRKLSPADKSILIVSTVIEPVPVVCATSVCILTPS
jgi:Reverse transcriptase (RNA-dependent DNA polymerase)